MQIGVLGPFEVLVDGRRLPLGSPQQRAVLALLALRPNQVVATGALVDALWPDAAPASAVQVVRTYVSRLRRVLAAAGAGARLEGRPPGYELIVDPLFVDARRFEQLAARGQDDLVAGRAGAAATDFRRALDLWRGDLLADLAWLEPAQAAAGPLGELRLAALEGRIEADLALGRHAALVPELRALAEEHPFRERLWGQLMVALYRAGRQAEALATYRRVRAEMVEQFGIEPGRELQELERRVLLQSADLQQRSEEPAVPPLPSMLAHPVHGRPLAGRDREWAVLSEVLDQAGAGHFGAVLVSGPPGIGKTALAARFAQDARRAGATVLLGRADEGSPEPYLALRQAIAHWWRHRDPEDRRGRLGNDDLLALAQVAPVILDGADEAGASPGGGRGEPDRLELFHAVVRWVEAAAESSSPLVLVLDDVQWADPATLLAIRHLLRHPPSCGALLVATHRDVDLGGGHPLFDLLSAAHSEEHVRRIALPGLDDAEVARLIAEIVDRVAIEIVEPRPDGVDPTFAAEIARMTGGNPLFVHEAIRHLIEQGAVDPGAGRWIGAASLRAHGVPDGVKEVIDQRLRRLPAGTAVALRQASVIGERFDLRFLATMTDRTVADVACLVEPALEARLLRRDAGGAGAVSFAHSLVRDVVLDGMPSTERADVHWRAGRELQRRGPTATDRPLGEIAHHLTAGVEAGDPRSAMEANVRAGDHALSAIAFEDAASFFGTALDLLDHLVEPCPLLSYDAGFGLGQAAGALNDRPRQRHGFLHAAAVARAQGWADRLAHAAIGVVDYVNAASEVPQPGDAGRRDQLVAQELLDDALARLGDGPTVQRLLLLTHQATRSMTLGRPDRARAFADAALATARCLDHRAAVPFAHVAQLWTGLGRPCRPALRTAPEQALGFSAPPHSRNALRVFVMPMLPIVALHLGDREELDAVRERMSADPVTRGSVHLTAYSRMWDGAVARCEGRLAEAECIAGTLRTATDGNLWNGIADMQAIAVAVDRGDPGVAALLSLYLTQAPDSLVARSILASVQAADCDVEAAARQVSALRSRRALENLDWSAPLVLRHVAEVAARLHDRRLAAELLPLLSPYGGQLLVPFHGSTVEAAADRAIGQLLSVLGRHDEAVDRLRSARALEWAFGAPALAVHSDYWLARALSTRAAPGDLDDARRLLDDVAATAERLGLDRLRRDVEASG